MAAFYVDRAAAPAEPALEESLLHADLHVHPEGLILAVI